MAKRLSRKCLSPISSRKAGRYTNDKRNVGELLAKIASFVGPSGVATTWKKRTVRASPAITPTTMKNDRMPLQSILTTTYLVSSSTISHYSVWSFSLEPRGTPSVREYYGHVPGFKLSRTLPVGLPREQLVVKAALEILSVF